MAKRHKDALQIYAGASNPRAVARALVAAIDEAVEEVIAEGVVAGSVGAKDPAVQMILDHLAFLCGLPMPSLDMDLADWLVIEDAVIAGAKS